jgi:uncharacterized protein (TIGR00725 family)
LQERLIAVIGSGSCGAAEAANAFEVGRLLAQQGFGVVCGGMGGVMESVCHGCHEASGVTVGLLPGLDPAEANPYVQIAIPTGLDEVRNPMVVRAGEAVIAVCGEYGTLMEIGFALKSGKRCIGLGTWELHRGGGVDKGIIVASTPEEAVRLAIEGL